MEPAPCCTARWNSPGRRVIYAAETYAGALLEVLVHASGSIPKNQACIRIDIPAGISIERVAPTCLAGKAPALLPAGGTAITGTMRVARPF